MLKGICTDWDSWRTGMFRTALDAHDARADERRLRRTRFQKASTINHDASPFQEYAEDRRRRVSFQSTDYASGRSL
jgi:hypothetical protein